MSYKEFIEGIRVILTGAIALVIFVFIFWLCINMGKTYDEDLINRLEPPINHE